MRQKLTGIAFVVLALVLLVEPALAFGLGEGRVLAGPEKVQPQKHIISFTGTIASVDSVGKKIAVTIQMTNYPYIARRGDTEWVTTTSSTIFYVWSGKLRTRATFSSLKAGQRVSVNATATTTQITASRVEVNKPRY